MAALQDFRAMNQHGLGPRDDEWFLVISRQLLVSAVLGVRSCEHFFFDSYLCIY